MTYTLAVVLCGATLFLTWYRVSLTRKRLLREQKQSNAMQRIYVKNLNSWLESEPFAENGLDVSASQNHVTGTFLRD